MKKNNIIDSLRPYKHNEIEKLKLLYKNAKDLNSIDMQEKIAVFSQLLDDLQNDEEKINAFSKNPEKYLSENKKYIQLLDNNIVQKLSSINAKDVLEIEEEIAQDEINAESIKKTIYSILIDHKGFKKAIIASTLLAILYINIFTPFVKVQDYNSTQVYGKRPESVTLARNVDDSNKLILHFKNDDEETNFYKANALSKLARDIYENPSIAKIFNDNPKEYLAKIGFSDISLNTNDYEVKFAMLLGIKEVRDMVDRQDHKKFMQVINKYFVSDVEHVNMLPCSAVAVCLAYILVGGYNGVVAVNWVGATVTLLAYLAVGVWTYVGGGGGGQDYITPGGDNKPPVFRAELILPKDRFAIEYAYRIGGNNFGMAVLIDVYKKYLEEARLTISESDKQMLARVESELQKIMSLA